jgi:cyclomaltodextrinase / maltogenic alpha-amylase / neopullulanase
MKLEDATFYHIYPLGALGVINAKTATPENENTGGTTNSAPLLRLVEWIPLLKRLGTNTLYLGPVFESEYHGYDTIDYLTVDSRLGSNTDLAALSATLMDHGIGLVLDAVFNHVGRNHPIVQDVIRKGTASSYAQWIADFDPTRQGPDGMPFSYRGWAGHYELVGLNTANAEVQEYLIGTALGWIDDFGVAGLRLDAADCLDLEFMRELGRRCREKDPEFFLIGEAVHGDGYAPMLSAGGLDAVTNYEAFKALWSSYNDRNYHEIAWTLNRLFGDEGLCRDRLLYSFADNHDVDRVASLIRDPAGLYPLYGLLFSMPGVPSLYYGSEFGIQGRKHDRDDSPLRPALDPDTLDRTAEHPDLAHAITRFSAARRASPAVRHGSYRLLAVDSQAIAFLRVEDSDPCTGCVLIAVNGSTERIVLSVQLPESSATDFQDLLDPGYYVRQNKTGRLSIDIPSHWLRWLVPAGTHG